jgi:hypothetical protein
MTEGEKKIGFESGPADPDDDETKDRQTPLTVALFWTRSAERLGGGAYGRCDEELRPGQSIPSDRACLSRSYDGVNDAPDRYTGQRDPYPQQGSKM